MDAIEEFRLKLEAAGYLIERPEAALVYLSLKMNKPLLVEGPAGVGKTELARALAAATGCRMIRLQCYEGLDETKALYEWNYHKQLLRLYADRSVNRGWDEVKDDIFTEEYLLARPLLKSLISEQRVVLLIDEIDKSDEEFESFLLEFLSDFQVSIPELGTIAARHVPVVVLTSNNARDFGDALKRRCIHLYLDYPSYERELRIVRLKLPGIGERLCSQVVRYVQRLREEKLKKVPSIAETLDWAQALVNLGADCLDEETVRITMGILLKYKSDIDKISAKKLSSLLPQ